ncbi:YeeE/YedE family protein [Thiobacillus sedimenti]|uniref:YeeE/YedE family protein n=1 Tax=Thiobacillus sedimenti TaxID=3110231 RepID=A0ABZ1CFG0_9PROT|nr:YeeE/YedE family protein [Thiobacillus sp. SCUT-2]WRS38109.1 YeeE/YedE family protein [Thiobacillus sp. SCUT-2]
MDPGYPLILASSLVIGVIAGIVMHRADFCVTASFRDMFLFRDFFLMRQMVLVVVVSMALFEFGRLSGLIAAQPFPLLGTPSLANAIGGFIFGIGMVLAGGCVTGTLYKLGSGSAASGLAFVGMLAGSAAYAEIHPQWSAFARATALARDVVTVPQWLGLSPSALLLPIALAGAAWLAREFRAGRMQRPGFAVGHLAPWRAAVVLALLGFASYVLIGMPMGITTAYTKLGANIEALFAPGHVSHLAYFALQPLDYTPPFADHAVQGGPGPRFDAIGAIQYPLILGIAGGAMASAMQLGEWRLHWRLPPRQFVSALAGGLLIGLAARMVPSCNLWHLWGGLPILALQSLLFLAGLLPGTWAGSRLLARFVIR